MTECECLWPMNISNADIFFFNIIFVLFSILRAFSFVAFFTFAMDSHVKANAAYRTEYFMIVLCFFILFSVSLRYVHNATSFSFTNNKPRKIVDLFILSLTRIPASGAHKNLSHTLCWANVAIANIGEAIKLAYTRNAGINSMNNLSNACQSVYFSSNN